MDARKEIGWLTFDFVAILLLAPHFVFGVPFKIWAVNLGRFVAPHNENVPSHYVMSMRERSHEARESVMRHAIIGACDGHT